MVALNEERLQEVPKSPASESCGLPASASKEYRPRIVHAMMMTTGAFVQVLVIAATFGGTISRAACFPGNSQGLPVTTNRDPVAIVLAASQKCPVNVFEFRDQILKAGGKIESAIVNNQGFHNPNVGNFSLFEMVSGRMDEPVGVTVASGDFFFGHFTATQGGTLIANQVPQDLMIELIAFDPIKEAFNFYELIGEGKQSKWFYRGDSLDVVSDISLLHRQKNPAKPVAVAIQS